MGGELSKKKKDASNFLMISGTRCFEDGLPDGSLEVLRRERGLFDAIDGLLEDALLRGRRALDWIDWKGRGVSLVDDGRKKRTGEHVDKVRGAPSRRMWPNQSRERGDRAGNWISSLRVHRAGLAPLQLPIDDSS